MSTHYWLKLPSGRILNMGAVAEIEPHGETVAVSFVAGASDTVDGVSDVYLARQFYSAADARALVAHFDTQAVVVVAPAA